MFGPPSSRARRQTVAASVPTNGYNGNGAVNLLGQMDPEDDVGRLCSSTNTEQYNGIWGFTVGSRQYALTCGICGLHIIDFTDPASPVRVQAIQMAGGDPWRDAETHTDPTTGKTYAYVAGQAGADLWVIDLSFLSGTSAQGQDSNPIPSSGINEISGCLNRGHTLTVGGGLLFLNTAGSSEGCYIWDLLEEPFNLTCSPGDLNTSYQSGFDCHDSYSRFNEPTGPGGQARDVLYAADGYSGRVRMHDITNIRDSGFSFSSSNFIGQTSNVDNPYAHSVHIADGSDFLFLCEEFNRFDMKVFNIADQSNPTDVGTFTCSDCIESTPVHNGFICGDDDRLYCVAHYKAGLRIFDVANPYNIKEVGKLETYRDPDQDGNLTGNLSGFSGAWNVYKGLANN